MANDKVADRHCFDCPTRHCVENDGMREVRDKDTDEVLMTTSEKIEDCLNKIK